MFDAARQDIYLIATITAFATGHWIAGIVLLSVLLFYVFQDKLP